MAMNEDVVVEPGFYLEKDKFGQEMAGLERYQVLKGKMGDLSSQHVGVLWRTEAGDWAWSRWGVDGLRRTKQEACDAVIKHFREHPSFPA